MQALRKLLADAPPGPVPVNITLDRALATCWDDLRGSDEGGMEAYKLLGRMVNVQWLPPILTFTVERHGGTVKGSTRAEVQHWKVNLDSRTAGIVKVGHRQLQPMALRISIKSIADEIIELIVSGKDDERIRRQKDGSVKIVMAKVFPPGSGFNRTVQGRRKRLVEYVKEQLAKHGWVSVAGNAFRRHA